MRRARSLDARFYAIRPWRLGFDIARAYALIGVGLALGLLAGPWGLLPAVLLIGSQQYALQVLNHDALHGRLLRSKRQSDRLARLLICYPVLQPLAGFRRKHLDHHRHLGTAADPDRYYHASADKSTRGAFLFFLTGLRSALATLLRRHERLDESRGRDAGVGADENRRDLLRLAGTQLAIAALLTALGGISAYPLLWILPYGLGVFAAQNLRSFAEHAHPEPDRLADAHRNVTIDAARLERFFLAPNNMNYHAEHHMFPQVPYYHLPALRAHLEAQGLMDGVEYRTGYIGFVWRFWRALPLPS